jgi:hypothetical protein
MHPLVLETDAVDAELVETAVFVEVDPPWAPPDPLMTVTDAWHAPARPAATATAASFQREGA